MTRMVKITYTYLIDVDADSSAEAERIAQNMLDTGLISLDNPTKATCCCLWPRWLG